MILRYKSTVNGSTISVAVLKRVSLTPHKVLLAALSRSMSESSMMASDRSKPTLIFSI